MLTAVEKQLGKLPYWFDGQRLSASAMEQLGPAYQPALQVVRHELKGLLERAPGLMDLSFNDGTPFVSESTRFWLTQSVLTSETGGSDHASEGNSALVDVHQAAMKQAASGQVASALADIQHYARTAGSRREEYQARLLVAELMIDCGHDKAALPILVRMADYIESHGLAEWEPDLTQRVYTLLHQAYAKQSSDQDPSDVEPNGRQATAFDNLCWYAPGSAVT